MTTDGSQQGSFTPLEPKRGPKLTSGSIQRGWFSPLESNRGLNWTTDSSLRDWFTPLEVKRGLKLIQRVDLSITALMESQIYFAHSVSASGSRIPNSCILSTLFQWLMCSWVALTSV